MVSCAKMAKDYKDVLLLLHDELGLDLMGEVIGYHHRSVKRLGTLMEVTDDEPDLALAILCLDVASEHIIMAWTIEHSRPHILEFLLSIGVNPRRRNGVYLLLAVAVCNIEAIRLLLDYGVDIHIRGDLAYWLARTYRHNDVCEYLKSRGANTLKVNNEMLCEALESDLMMDALALIHYGADINTKMSKPLITVLRDGNLLCAEVMLEMGVDLQKCRTRALITAAQDGRLDVIEWLVARGANGHARNDLALREAKKNGHREVADYLSGLPRLKRRHALK